MRIGPRICRISPALSMGPFHSSARSGSGSRHRAILYLGDRDNHGLTFAPEAGSNRMRRVINKMITDEEMLDNARAAFETGWPCS